MKRIKNVDFPKLNGRDPGKVLEELATRPIYLIFNTYSTMERLYKNAGKDISELNPDDNWKLKPLRRILENHKERSEVDLYAIYCRLEREAIDGYLIEFVEK